MDLFTQGLAGAVVAQSAARPAHVRLATLVGFVAGLLADADILIRSADDPLLTLEYHRQFTHSLFFVPVGGLLGALLLWPMLRHRLRFRQTWLLAALGFLPSGLLDACTSYGTQLFWPVSDARVAWNVIAIIDPLFSLTLAVALAVGLFGTGTPAPGSSCHQSRLPGEALMVPGLGRNAIPARIGLTLALFYLLFGTVQRERAEGLATALAEQRGHSIERLEVKPTLGNLLLWRSINESDGRFHVDAVRVGLLQPPQIYEGGTVERFRPETLAGLGDTVLAEDIDRFIRFSDRFVARHPELPHVLGDVRYAMLPNDTAPLWGIEINMEKPNEHVEFRTFRTTDAATRHRFMAMLFGEPLD